MTANNCGTNGLEMRGGFQCKILKGYNNEAYVKISHNVVHVRGCSTT